MSVHDPTGPSPIAAFRSYIGFLDDAAIAVDALYEMGDLNAAEDLDAIVADLEAVLEDAGDFEGRGDGDLELPFLAESESAHL